MNKYDILIVGSGLFGATVAYRARKAGKKVLVLEKREHLGGNVYCEELGGINVYSIVSFNRYTNCPVIERAMATEL